MEPGPRTDKEQAARADLARLRREGDALGGMFGRSRDYFAAADAPSSDSIEKWGRRIGRTLSAVAFVALAVYLYVTYVL
ncbi:MAG: hypothetical protein AB7V13_08020 [Pseudorhodoplanes sp.]|uniref:hypothetical protein n=1 Tax=Pseudorhodoplanes sp. TaxID=1934341 RepID=UPI003D10AF1B